AEEGGPAPLRPQTPPRRLRDRGPPREPPSVRRQGKAPRAKEALRPHRRVRRVRREREEKRLSTRPFIIASTQAPRSTNVGIQFLGIGAQKAGTTWLYEMLRLTPEVWMPPVKELHYFSRSPRYPSPSHLTSVR